jgi:hypothetical protein
MRVGVVGADGKMGREVCRALVAQADLDLVAAVDTVQVGADLGPVGPDSPGVSISDRLEALIDAGTEVVVDFTRIEAARHTLAFCADAGIHAVVGTTGFTDDDLDELTRRVRRTGPPQLHRGTNFAIGAVLMMRFAELAAPWFAGAEIVELHHDGKLDAPSGTALPPPSGWRPHGSRRDRAVPPRPHGHHGVDGRPRRSGPGRRAHPFGPPSGPGRPPGGDPRVGGPEPDHPPRFLRPRLVHGRGGPGRPVGGRPTRCHPRTRAAAGPLSLDRRAWTTTRQRILEATYVCVARWGLAKTTVEDAAREAKVSRATVYRTFPGGGTS